MAPARRDPLTGWPGCRSPATRAGFERVTFHAGNVPRPSVCPLYVRVSVVLRARRAARYQAWIYAGNRGDLLACPRTGRRVFCVFVDVRQPIVDTGGIGLRNRWLTRWDVVFGFDIGE